jgi:hypothetical protein
MIDRGDVLTIARRAKDWMFVRSGNRTRLQLTGITVPFGHEAHGESLSDHYGYVAHFTLTKLEPPPL